ncbi:DUF4198 domain-containing protein [Pasteurellaceae bacterium HPA106]|uniref:DUF4198 domain-containing protein n=1 Tax=Spirabiliibacterium pneumoniae TaxID=221400 RepID=UPI001AADBA19|nr:DUF4198 domain-containing protein [Spirabiliibacterium pneumoniae]MBE2896910.1 DUF4198 domain-containing protein [Spirabiliibacterium pneumoniae]
MKLKSLYALAFAGLFATSANAHNLFPVQTEQGYGIQFWADDHWELPDFQQVIGVSAYNNDGKRLKVGFDFQNGNVSLKDEKAQVGLMTAEYDYGYFTFTADKHFHKPRTEVQGVIFDSRHIYKLGKSIFTWNDAYSQPVGLKLEVTPLSNPLTLKEGDKLKVLVTYNGQPFNNVEFEDQAGDLDDVVIKDGVAELTLRKAQDGYQILGATAKLPYQLQDDKAQTLQLTGTLAFKSAK